MHTHLAATVPLALSTQGLVGYQQGLLGPIIVGIVAIFFLFTREITRFVRFMVLAVVFYTPSIMQTLTMRRSQSGGPAVPRNPFRIADLLSGEYRIRLSQAESSRRYAIL